jgi:predicted metal-binding membrane protein
MTATQTSAGEHAARNHAEVIDRPRVPRAVPVAVGLAWAAIIALHITGHGASVDHDSLLGPGGHLDLTSLLVYAAAWITMITAMMLPSAVPLLGLFAGVSRGQPRAGLVVAAFASGYLAVWMVFGWLALGFDTAVHTAVEASPWLHERPQLVIAAVLALAGAFQFSSLKDRCLSTCRHPGAYLLSHYRRGAGAALRIGCGHGLFCLGCCWALMLVAFAAGVANLWWMAALTALMVFEKTGREGQRGVRPIGLGLIALGMLMLAEPAVLPWILGSS